MKRLSYVLALCLFFFANAAFAQAAGFQFAAPNFRAPKNPEVSGVRFSVIHGENQVQSGLDMGLL